MTNTANTEVGNHVSRTMHLRDEAFDHVPIAQIVVDSQGKLAMANRQARVLFGLTPQDVGCRLQDLELSYRPAELRSRIQQAYKERCPVQITNVEFGQRENNSLYLDIHVIPLFNNNAEVLGVSIVFNDVARYNRLQQELHRATQELETASEELQSTNEELETASEERQSTNEELETMNEELQSTNEELETINEELQSTNEELQTINEELRSRTEQLNHANAYAESILSSLQAGVVVLDNRLSVQIWNSKAEDLWGLRAQEAQGHFFFDLNIGLPVEQLRDIIRSYQTQVLTNQNTIILKSVNRFGRTINCRVICTPLVVGERQQGVILLMEQTE